MTGLLIGTMLLALLWLLVRRRAMRKATLSGLNGERPVFSVDPPARRLAPRKGERL